MAQFGRPISDASIGAWTDEAAGTINIYTGIDEVSAEDTEYITSEANPSSSPYVCGLTTSLEDPVSSSGHVMRWRRQKSASGGADINLTVQLRQGYVSEGTPGTQITSQSDAAIPATWTDTSYTLSGAEADSITNYTDLFIRIVATQV